MASNGERLVTSKFQGPQRNMHFAAGCAYLGGLSFGYMIGYSSPALPDMQRKSVLSDTQASWFGSLVNIGAMIGAIVAGWMTEKFGRKFTLMFATLPFMIGWSQIYYGGTVNNLYLGRMLTGIGSGIVTVVCPLYIAETATKERRGFLGSGVQLSVTVGILLVYVLGIYNNYKSLAAIGIIIPAIAAVMTVRIPETPRFHLLHNKKQEAANALKYLRGAHADVEDEIRDIQESMDSDEKVSWTELFKKAEMLQPLKIAMGLMFFQQFTGINVVMFYTVSIFESAGFKENGSFTTMIIGAVQVLATFLACLLMDKAGRRVLLILAGVGMAISCAMMGLYYYWTAGNPQGAPPMLATFSLIAYIVAFSIGWGPIPMLVMSEITPVKARGAASAITVMVAWVSSFIVTKEFSTVQAIVEMSGTFWIFGLFCVIGIVFVAKLVPETKGKSLEDIELYFLGRAMRGI